ncbi:MAG: lytic murein transglycosylase, partial [Rhodobiaceae bacterium]|nr:lytic murein transglycosylase [Rhodobiaceae bacterium]
AMGHTQFIPTTYNAYAVDFTGDGRRDIWDSIPDALASTANYLKRAGWQSGKTWGYEVKVSRTFNYGLADGSTKRSISEWQKLGVGRANGRPFPRGGDQAYLTFPAGARGPGFLMLQNSRVIRRYNNAFAYALAVGHLADRIGGGNAFVSDWPRGDRPLGLAERKEMQSILNRQGYAVGTVDGKVGPATRAAIRSFQLKAGLPADGNASLFLLQRLKAGG